MTEPSMAESPELFGQQAARELLAEFFPKPEPKRQAVHLTQMQMHRLRAACLPIERAFEGEKVWLVGSVLKHDKFRDVDLRVILDDGPFIALFGGDEMLPYQMRPFWCLLCSAVSEMVAARTGLEIDFQVQMRSRITEEDWDKVRNPLNMHIDAPPPWVA